MRKVPTFFWEYRGNDIPDADLSTYRLALGGAVGRSLDLSLADLASLAPPVEVDRRFYCVNGWSLQAIWRGHCLATLLAEAGVRGDGGYLRVTSIGGYEDTTAVAELIRGDAMLVTHMNGDPLSPQRGKPIRLMRFDCYQFKGVKAVARMDVVQEYRPGTWEKVGYSDATIQPYPHLAIDRDEELLPEGDVLTGGTAATRTGRARQGR